VVTDWRCKIEYSRHSRESESAYIVSMRTLSWFVGSYAVAVFVSAMTYQCLTHGGHGEALIFQLVHNRTKCLRNVRRRPVADLLAHPGKEELAFNLMQAAHVEIYDIVDDGLLFLVVVSLSSSGRQEALEPTPFTNERQRMPTPSLNVKVALVVATLRFRRMRLQKVSQDGLGIAVGSRCTRSLSSSPRLIWFGQQGSDRPSRTGQARRDGYQNVEPKQRYRPHLAVAVAVAAALLSTCTSSSPRV
jgi:hypothetical protein